MVSGLIYTRYGIKLFFFFFCEKAKLFVPVCTEKTIGLNTGK